MVRFFADSRITCRKTSAITHYLMAPGNKDNILSAVALRVFAQANKKAAMYKL